MSPPLEDPRAELEALAHATRRAASRRKALGGAKRAPSKATKAAAAPARTAGPVNLTGPARTAEDVRAQAAAAKDLESLRACVSRCEACGLSKTRNQTVFMDGQGTRALMFVGEAPGADEDAQGVPFVGRAGKLLTDIIEKGMGIARGEITIANVLKCRPPENREPTPTEKATCTPWLDRQIELVDPAVLVPLGRHAAMHVLGIEESMGAMRARIHERGGRKVVPTYHPAYLLRSPGEKKECWKDIQLAMGVLGMPIPPRSDTGSSPASR
ncbi:MAG: uracil-DNA glycosylase [Planctomycetes bacterium]|nr:uracil-DNA glycosylase [Planctomycetota bacterium]